MKKTLTRFTLLLMILSLLAAIPVFALEEEEDEEQNISAQAQDGTWGTCGDEVAWTLEGSTLTISGYGPMEDFDAEAPWADYKDEIKKVVFTGGVTTVGAHSFEDYDALTEVDFGDSMHTLGPRCLAYCDGLVRIHLPATFRIFGFECLRSCHSLKAIHCDGGAFPSFKESCLWDSEVKIYYPASNPWPVNLIEQLENAFSHRIEFVDSEGTDHWISGYETVMIGEDPELTEPETEPDTEPETTVPETTQPETTVPVTTVPETTVPETTQAPVTEPETEPETEYVPVWTTVAPTEAPAKRAGGTGRIVAIVLVVLVLFSLGMGALLFRRSMKHRY